MGPCCGVSLSTLSTLFPLSLTVTPTPNTQLQPHPPPTHPLLPPPSPSSCVLKFVGLDSEQRLDMDSFTDALSDRTKLVAINHASNTLGCVNPVEDIIMLAHAVGAKVLLDACQSVPHMPVDVQDLDCDFLVASGERVRVSGVLVLPTNHWSNSQPHHPPNHPPHATRPRHTPHCLPGHKMCGPTGIGFLYGKYDTLAAMPPWQGGGEMIDEVFLDHSTYAAPPGRFEAGEFQRFKLVKNSD